MTPRSWWLVLGSILGCGGGGHCLVTWTGRSAQASEGGATLREQSRIGDWSGAQCTADLSDAQVATARILECGFAEVWVGKKI